MNDTKTEPDDDIKEVVPEVLSNSEEPLPTNSDPPSKFSKKEKWFIVIFTAFVAFFSPLTATIYYPEIPLLSKAFHKSTELINLTVTTYVVLQGVAPMVWGPVADQVGRRPTYALCLLILALSCIGLALVPTSNYGMLIGLRCLQACGSASTIAIGAGVIGDISTRAERGGFYGIFTIGPTTGPALGPVIGGALAQRFGWRSSFWFLCIASSICVVVIVLFQPETLRHIVESGRDTTPIIYKPVIPIIGRNTPRTTTPKPTVKVPKNPFGLFLNPDVDLLLFINGILFATFYGVLVTMSSLMLPKYPFLNETTLGLCFLSIGGGTIVGSVLSGRILDHEYQRVRQRILAENKDSVVNLSREENFPLEKARLRIAPYFVIVLAATCASYGWCLKMTVNISILLILQFLVGSIAILGMNATNTLLIDIVPGRSSSVTACSNLIRCSISAIMVSVIDLIAKALGDGWTFVLLSGLCVITLPMMYAVIAIGPRFRIKRQRLREETAQNLNPQIKGEA
ncbi:hypothetical protein GALMADRAFT_223989 [Galerina marginata CBS 339.88]|uniref:Major facilitator superfamily (MFS) profile domain-containing protein n=1 Tax=Galerina marginata (strain CBS 339.88) TaxID=685588 RepID=A0A067T6H0_GALM3|nr:hypothetical protein GALMADRAFT_223989 [Galerina marginata CBS 339.88]